MRKLHQLEILFKAVFVKSSICCLATLNDILRPTPKMSSYLLAFAVGDFVQLSGKGELPCFALRTILSPQIPREETLESPYGVGDPRLLR